MAVEIFSRKDVPDARIELNLKMLSSFLSFNNWNVFDYYPARVCLQ